MEAMNSTIKNFILKDKQKCKTSPIEVLFFLCAPRRTKNDHIFTFKSSLNMLKN